MADFTTAEKINIFVKMVFGVQGFSNTDDAMGLRWYNEKFSWLPFTINKELYIDDVPTAADASEADDNVDNYPDIVEKRDIKLSLVSGTNGRGWIAYQTYNTPASGIYSDWLLPQIFGQGYAMKLFRDNGSGTGVGAEITTTEGAWVPVYKLGGIVLADNFTASDLGWAQPLWARVYRYVGNKGITGSTAGVGLDDAYNIGRSIAVDEGAVVLNASNNYAPLQITPIAYTPSASLAAGQLCNRGGILYAYDGTRTKWLSVDQVIISYYSTSADANYLATGFLGDIDSGFTALRDGTIVSISASGGSGNQTKSFAVRKKGSMTDIITFSLSSGTYSSTATDTDFSAGDVLQVYASADGSPAKSVRVDLTVVWRI